jgi:cell division septum initiation protein DivIVA
MTVAKLTEDMTRLCEEIQTLRANREGLKKELAEATKARQVEVVKSCAAFADALARKAGLAHDNRMSFLGHLKHHVSEQAREMQDDLAMVRRVWGQRRA